MNKIPIPVVASVAVRFREHTNNEPEVFLAMRLPTQTFPNHWHLPGGKVNVGESLETALDREVREELGVACIQGEQLALVNTKFTFGFYTVHFVRTTLAGKPNIHTTQNAAFRWFTNNELRAVKEIIEVDRCVALLAVAEASLLA